MFVHYLSEMQKPWDIENWDRKSAYEFFKTFEDPYVGIQVNLDCTSFVQQCKMHSYSTCLLYTSPSPRDGLLSRMPSSA